MEYLVGLDLGTTALKIALFDKNGSLMAVSTQEYALLTPKVNYVEQEVEVYWNAFQTGLQELLKQCPMGRGDTVALAISAQGETMVCLGADNKPLRNAIVWMDNRADREARDLAEHFGNDTCYRVTGQVSFEPCWPASKILWLRNNEPDTFAKTQMYLLLEDYFIYRMTGLYATEGSLVCSSTYWDIINKCYWTEMLDYLGIRESQLAPVRESGEVVGPMLPELAAALGLPPEVTVCTGALDQAAGAIGVGNIREGMFSENIGSALAICVPVSQPKLDPNGLMPLHYFALPDMYMMHTFTTGGMTLRWFRDKFCQEEMGLAPLMDSDPYALMDKEAETIPVGSEGLSMLPHLSGSLAPDVNAKAKGVWFGVTLKHTKAHFIRSIMESLGYILQRNIEALGNMGIPVTEIRSLGGGSKSPLWNQIKADITGKRLVTMESKEAACLGAAILAGKATGVFGSLEDAVDSMALVKKAYEPDPANREAYDKGYQMYNKLFADLGSAFEKTV